MNESDVQRLIDAAIAAERERQVDALEQAIRQWYAEAEAGQARGDHRHYLDATIAASALNMYYVMLTGTLVPNHEPRCDSPPSDG